MAKSTSSGRTRKADRPKKPYSAFPLTPHASGKWQKKINGSTYYFGKWAKVVNGKLERIPGDGWKEALEAYKAQADDLHAGRTPEKPTDGATVKDLCDAFYTAKQRAMNAGEITPRTLAEYDKSCKQIVKAFGRQRKVENLRPSDFEALREILAERFGPVRLGNEVQRVRSVFKYGFENGLTDAVKFGTQFVRPKRNTLRKHRAESGVKMFEADELRLTLEALSGQKVTTYRTDKKTGDPVEETLEDHPQLRAMVLLGLNAGYGQSDVSRLPKSALDFDGGWVEFPRPKTGIPRRCKLWKETIQAIQESFTVRPQNADHENLVFLTPKGKPWIRESESADPSKWASRTDLVGKNFSSVLRKLGINGRKRLGFYSIRHTFQTIAEECGDFPAIKLVMGHANDNTMSGAYRERISDARLERVAETVRAWLFGEGGEK